jgi:hypothetical protein
MTGNRRRQLGIRQKAILEMLHCRDMTSDQIGERLWPEEEPRSRSAKACQILRVLRMKGFVEIKGTRSKYKLHGIRSPIKKSGGLVAGDAVIHINRPTELESGFRYVMTDDGWWEAVPVSESENRRVITCSCLRCYRPAIQIDHLFPFENEYTRCEVHK